MGKSILVTLSLQILNCPSIKKFSFGNIPIFYPLSNLHCRSFSTSSPHQGIDLSKYKFSKEHDWICPDPSNPKKSIFGITDVAQKALGDIVFVELPAIGKSVELQSVIGTVESVKGASDIFSPVSGKVSEINSALQMKPNLMNKDPYSQGWMCKFDMDDPSQLQSLMTEAEYKEYCRTHPHH